MIEELGEKTRVVATGGLAPLISPASELIETVDDTLTLEGLRFNLWKDKELAANKYETKVEK